ncbi:MAG TPA: hypothetical protein VFX65_07280 [Candidatus Limnocylindrales bacterium]|nr:hypothetical protein [Candidatus Limnocylindrales bacterium]
MTIDFQSFKLVHLHGDERIPMHEGSHHDVAAHDPERSWASGARIFRCTRCDEEILVLPAGAAASDAKPA